MATEKRLIPDGKKVTLDELLPGTIFAFGDDCIAVKSEYRSTNGLIESFIIDSGEQFWGGAKTAKEQNALVVQPLAIEEVVHGHWIEFLTGQNSSGYECSEFKPHVPGPSEADPNIMELCFHNGERHMKEKVCRELTRIAEKMPCMTVAQAIAMLEGL